MKSAEITKKMLIWVRPPRQSQIDFVSRTFFNPATIRQEGQSMKNPLDSLWGTIITGVILTAILYYIVKNVLN